MTSHISATPWSGRADEEISAYSTRRWHHHVLPAGGTGIAARAGLLGFGCDVGVRRNGGRTGAAQAPGAIRGQLANLAWHEGEEPILDFGDVNVSGDALEDGQEKLGVEIAQALPRVGRLAVLGGGHETAYGSFLGLNRVYGGERTIGIINLDAHFDLRFPGSRGPSSGTPFYQIHETLGTKPFHYACLGIAQEANTAALFQRAREWGVSWLADHEMQAHRMDHIRAFLDAFLEKVDLVYLTLDLDVLPHYQAPGVSAPAARGVPLEVIESVIDHLTGAGAVPMPLVDIVELNPEHDAQSMTARTAALLVRRMLAHAPEAGTYTNHKRGDFHE